MGSTPIGSTSLRQGFGWQAKALAKAAPVNPAININRRRGKAKVEKAIGFQSQTPDFASVRNLDLNALSEKVRYGGNPEHKRDPGDFGLTPPTQPRRDKTLCDEIHIHTREAAESLLREGIRRGLISEQTRNDLPQNVWAVAEDGYPLEAQLENWGKATYHGYPMPESDPFRNEVIARWQRP